MSKEEKNINEEVNEEVKEEDAKASEETGEAGTYSREVYKVSGTLLRNANTYVPINAKVGFAQIVANKCFERVEVSASQEDTTMALPSMYKEDSNKKSRYMMGALVKMYFGVDFEKEKDDVFLMTAEEYDRWAGGHIINQLERFKSDMELRDICFDILQDYRDLEKKVNTEIYSLLQIANEPVGRIIATIQMSATPEATQDLLKQLENVKAELDAYQAGKAGNILGPIGKEDYE